MRKKRRIAIVVQRYGEEVNGGAELAARWMAEHLQRHVEVQVITTCAIDYTTWENHYSSGISSVNGVPVQRFPIDSSRNWKQSQKQTRKILLSSHSIFDEIEWMKEQGPFSTPLFNFLVESYSSFDAFIFFTYMYATTYFGLPLVSDKSILIPTAHDDPYLSLPIFRSLFHLPRALVYLTEPEKQLVHTITQNHKRPFMVGGIGIEPPKSTSAKRFHQQYEIDGNFILYVGRIHESKNIPQLLEYFQKFQQSQKKPLKLVLIGKSHLDLPDHPDIIHLGFVSEQIKYDAIKAASLLIMPSLFESLSIIILEAWLVKTAVLVNGRCEVLKYQCRQSNGGLYYTSYDEFESALSQLLDSPQLCQQLGKQGHQFTTQHYTWDTIISKYQSLFEKITG